MKRLICTLLLLTALCPLAAAEWQWSARAEGVVSAETGRAPTGYLWIPPACERVRAVVVGQHNMSEETLFENPRFRARMERLDFALLWVTPILDMPWAERSGCRGALDGLLAALADESGYGEIASAPLVPVGHSALATFPWNFAAWNPHRTLAVVSLHGDAPRTNLTGYGGPNIEWGRTRNIDGIPALMIVGEHEWREARIRPALTFRMICPGACISLLGDAGRGHFDVSDRTAAYIARFLEKAAEQRLGDPLRAVDPAAGWLAERWRPGQTARAEAAPAAQYRGDPHDAFWYFDEEMARLAEARYAADRGKRPLYIGFEQQGAPLRYDERLHARIEGRFVPETDGATFRLRPFFSDSLRRGRAAEHPAGAPLLSRICGPVEVVDDTTLRIRFDRSTADNPRRGRELWLVAEHPGDDTFRGSVQQIVIPIPFRNETGRTQRIRFDSLPDIRCGEAAPVLSAESDCGLPVTFFVRSGPAEIIGGELRLTPIPPRARFPVRVTVAATQYGIAGKVRTAEPVERTFYITR